MISNAMKSKIAGLGVRQKHDEAGDSSGVFPDVLQRLQGGVAFQERLEYLKTFKCLLPFPFT
jgi:L-ribulose-5-phosphate 3-epimerase UlaE